MLSLKNSRSGYKSVATKLKQSLDAQDFNVLTRSTYNMFMLKLQDITKKLEENHAQILDCCADEEEANAHILDYEASLDALMEMSLLLSSWDNALTRKEIAELHQQQPQSTSHGHGQVKVNLPKLELPKFSGKLEDWITFDDLFTHVVHVNSDLSGAQKLQYLKSALQGDAARLLDAITIADGNYETAWKIVTDRYQHTREILHTHVNKFLQQPQVQSESASSLLNMIDVTNQSLNALRVLKCKPEDWNVILVTVLMNKLDLDTRRVYERSLDHNEMPMFEDLMRFLEKQARALNAGAGSRPKHQGGNQNKSNDGRPIQRPAPPVTNGKGKCSFCKDDHFSFQCKLLLDKNGQERFKFAQSAGVCLNCLRKGHISSQCDSSNCKRCNKKHHTLLHREDIKPETKREPVSALTTELSSPSNVLLATAVIRVMDNVGHFHDCRALLDNGSQASFVSTACARKLNLPQRETPTEVSGLAAAKVAQASHSIVLCMESRIYAGCQVKVDALLVPKVTCDLPINGSSSDGWSHTQGLKLADPEYYRPRCVDILLGADILNKVMKPAIINGKDGTPSAQDTVFGWALYGPVSVSAAPKIVSHVNVVPLDEIDATLRKFWEIETLATKRVFTQEEEDFVLHFQRTTIRNGDGSYQVSLPFKKNAKALGDSKQHALRRFYQVENRLNRNPHLKEQYVSFMNEYLTLGHMSLIPKSKLCQTTEIAYYLPHHPVLKESSSTTKLRVVFDASANTSTNVSLNDQLMVGPIAQDDLFSIMTRWRYYLVPLCADIKMMYRQIWMDEADWSYLRIFWREEASQPINEYWLKTVTYGTAPAPSQAVLVLHDIAEKCKMSHPLASKSLQSDFYMDDCMTGANTVEEALELQQQLLSVLKLANFTLRKWSSSEPAVLEAVPDDFRETQLPLTLDQDGTVKTLGMHWSPSADDFRFTFDPGNSKKKITKRNVLSDLARIFDPLGLLSPIIIKGKIIMQHLWKLKIDWDHPLPHDLSQRWIAFCLDLPELTKLRIPRCISTPNAMAYELHGFSDASEQAYAGVVYLRTISDTGNMYVRLIASKTKVAPLSQISLPRLELCGAELLANLMSAILSSLPVSSMNVYGWTDSTIVKHWLNAPPQRWKTYVANRVTSITKIIPPSSWNHVRGELNPADLPTRGMSAEELCSSTLWWNPPFLLQQKFPMEQSTESAQDVVEAQKEERNIVVSHVVKLDSSMVDNYSNIVQLQRHSAWLARFCKFLDASRKTSVCSGPLTVIELLSVLHAWIRVIQRAEFAEEVTALENNSPIPRTSKLLSLSPRLDDAGLLRVGGRLDKAALHYNERHPILLPRQSRLTRLIIEYTHRTLKHAGCQLVLYSLQQNYWIVRGRPLVRNCINKCIICVLQKAKTMSQVMGSLPQHRVTPSRPFSFVGIDYAGPVLLRTWHGRKAALCKAYIALFVCCSTKAMHLELVSDMTSETFLAALRRFTARRGRPTHIYSDCGTNFVGANRELQEYVKFLQTQEHNVIVSKQLASQGVQWSFNPPGAPHMGGLWEAGVKSAKFHLRRCLGDTPLTFEEYATLLCEVEACLNSRPLTPSSSDPTDLLPISPGHFLIGAPLEALPQPDLTDLKISHLSRWQHVQQITQHFWNRWSQEYLRQLQRRPKWNETHPDLKVGDLVVIQDERLPPRQWKMARVTEVHPGRDGRVRVATLKTADGELVRPIVKLCRLPVEDVE